MKHIVLPNGLERIGVGAFCESGLESITIPGSVRIVHQAAFQNCKSLVHAHLCDGLEALGVFERSADNESYGGVFDGSALKTIRLPSTLKTIEYRAFCFCKNLSCI